MTPPPVTFEHGEALDVLRRLPAGSFEGLFCDPPYGLRSGPAWDGEVPPAEVWAECLRVLTPGAWVLAFGGRRTHHRLMTAMEAGGLELRDVLSWLYATGPPPSRAALRPAWEPVVLARRPGPALPLNVEACRTTGPVLASDRRTSPRGRKTAWGTLGRRRTGQRHHPGGRWPASVLFTHGPECTAGGCAPGCPVGELGSVSRFYYCPKPAGREVVGNPHPTRKPLRLCTYLARLILPPGGGRLLVPFAGSGSEVLGALRAGWREVVAVEREARWLDVARGRLTREAPAPGELRPAVAE